MQQSDTTTISGRLRQRLSELGVPVVAIQPDGKAELIGPRRWEHELLVGSPLFARLMQPILTQLADDATSPREVWPGLTLMPINPPVKGKPKTETPSPTLFAMLLGRDVLDAEQLLNLCGAAGLDVQATKARFDHDALLGKAELDRLAQIIGWMVRDGRDLGWRLHELHDLSWELAGSYEELSLLYKLSTSMVVDHPPEAFLDQACREMREVVGLRWLAILPIPTEPGLADLPVTVCVGRDFSVDPEKIAAIGPALIDAMQGRGDPAIIDDTNVLQIPGLTELAKSLLVTPLHVDGKPLGLMFGGDKLDYDDWISSVDSKLCASLGGSLSIYLKNVLLYEDMHSMFLGTLHALSATIDAKDSYTHGHSERVALVSRQLAVAAGIDEQTADRIYLSALVHDVGKIGVPESVLTKPGKLTNEEYDTIKTHPEIGARIIERIRQMEDLIPGVLHHHEAWDGSGYPHGLKGRDIPLQGRIIGLADAFDAMSSDRTYRRAMPMDKVLEEIKRCSGKQFDPDLAEVFVGLDFYGYLSKLKQHHQRIIKDGPATPGSGDTP